MFHQPVHTKLSDLMSEDESPNSTTDVKKRINFKIEAIKHRANLKVESDALTDNRNSADVNAKCSLGNTHVTASKQDQNENLCQDLEKPDDKMSKRFGSLFRKGDRVATDKNAAKTEKESVLPHLKSTKLESEEAESSFIIDKEVDLKKESSSKQDNSEQQSKKGKKDNSTSDNESELGTRADPIGESYEVGMAVATDAGDIVHANNCDATEETVPALDRNEDHLPLPANKLTNDEINNINPPPKSSGLTETDVMGSEITNGASPKKDESKSSEKIKTYTTGMEDEQSEKKQVWLTRTKSMASNHTTSEKDSESDSSMKEQNQTKHKYLANSTGTDDEKKRSIKSHTKKNQIGSRATRSSLLRSRSVSNSDPHSRKSNWSRRGSNSSEESERSYKPGPPPLADPIPEINSDFKPHEYWQNVKEEQKADVKKQTAAKQEFSDKYRNYGLPKRAPSFVSNPTTPKHHQSNVSLVSLTSGQVSKNILKPEFNPFSSASDKYLTPLQQKEKTIRDLQTYIGKLEETIAVQGDEIANFNEVKEEALQYLAADKDSEINEVLQDMEKLEDEKDVLIDKLKIAEKALEEEKTSGVKLQDQIAKMEIETEEREEKHNQNYLKMYQKGREAQLIEQEEDIVCHAMANPGNAPNKQLIHRLEKTEKQLDKLRQTFRNETYKQAPHVESDSEAQVELLKSAVFYYLTDCQADTNLRTMLSMLSYSQVQKKNIFRHLEKKKK